MNDFLRVAQLLSKNLSKNIGDTISFILNNDDRYNTYDSNSWDELESYLKDDSTQNESAHTHYANNAQTNNFHQNTPNAAVLTDYETLQISYTRDLPTIRKAYKTLLISYHPDKFAHDEKAQAMASVVTQKITSAYQNILKYLGEKK